MNATRAALIDLAGRLPDEQLPGALTDLQRRLGRPTFDDQNSSDPFPWIGKGHGPSDASTPERIREALAAGFGRN